MSPASREDIHEPTTPHRSTLFLSFCLVLMAGGLGYQHFQLVQLRDSIDGAAEKTSIDAILSRLSNIDERLDSVDGKHLVTDDDFRAGQQALSNRIDAAQAYAKQATEAVEELSRNAASAGELLVLKATVETLDGNVQELRKAHQKSLPDSPEASCRQEHASAEAQTQARRPGTATLQHRGSRVPRRRALSSVAPPGSTRLSQIYLVRPGDVIAGTDWRLSSLVDRSARFDVTGNSRTLNIQP